MRQALIIAGPTCSGKSALALALAERLGGTVINADAMQCYRELRVLTARPTPEEEARAPHALYGVLPASVVGSVAWWRAAALEAMEGASLPILCGGTGMYLRALTQGLSALPDVTPAARAEARALLAELGPEALHARLNAEDAALIRPSDSQRIARAHEVWLSTGRSLAHWQRAAPLLPPAPYAFRAILLDPPRAELRAAIAARWQAMLTGGAREEVATLLAQGLDPALPAMRAHGVPELAALLRGEITGDEASRRAIANTGAYTRRQATWFRHQPLMAARHVPFAAPQRAHIINARFASLAQFSESEQAKIFAFLREGVDGAIPPP
ncbi:tRNA (adenosine(37)-N6)-dimethylallyltransferase MiaA [Roseococcus suduntuyensis]|uniref:tRNA dimethylallyltransferase n=1 Tax=Roseococcus suduntuyensis TaxID=455361 RepID=A0A840AAM4_9PROT|nr:tRNA (adenosine(37)-N6)-dimethylallyltransferase MiaA [Roseococcus suduntuyensis]MBB3898147.1 tRNA dimethylallyltransferase [Roseococcus suduntuyensis]